MLKEQCEHRNKGVKKKMLRSPIWLVGSKWLVQSMSLGSYKCCGQIVGSFGFYSLGTENQNTFTDSEVLCLDFYRCYSNVGSDDKVDAKKIFGEVDGTG